MPELSGAVLGTRHEGAGVRRAVIAEDSVLLRMGLVKVVEMAGFEVAAEVGDARGLLAAVEEHRPDLAVVDVRMPPDFTDEGVRAALSIRRDRPSTALLLLSQYVEERYAADLLAANTSGVGYLLKQRVADVEEFIGTLRRVADGGTALDPQVVAQLLVRRSSDPLTRLTAREREVLALMAEGRSNAGIAAELVVSESAVARSGRTGAGRGGGGSGGELHPGLLRCSARCRRSQVRSDQCDDPRLVGGPDPGADDLAPP